MSGEPGGKPRGQAQNGHGPAPAWRPAEDETLARLWERGVEVEEIGAALGRTAAAVRVRRGKIGLPVRHRRKTGPRGRALWMPEDDARLVDLWGRGLRGEELAKALGRTVMAIDNRRIRLGVKADRRGEAWGEEDDQRLETLRDEGWTNEEIGRELGRSGSAVEKRVSWLGLEVNPGRKRVRRHLVPAALALLVDEAEARRAIVGKITAMAGGPTVEVPGPARTCQYIEEQGGPPSAWTFCGKPAVRGRSYCGEHAAICYGRGREEERAV